MDLLTDPAILAPICVLLGVVVQQVLAPVVGAALSRRRTRRAAQVDADGKAVSALVLAIDQLQEENARLHAAIAAQDTQIAKVRARVTELEQVEAENTRLAHKVAELELALKEARHGA